MVEVLKADYPIQVIWDVIGYSRSRYYYKLKSEEPGQDELLKLAIADVAGRYPTYGCRRITKQLQREGWKANHKRVSRLIKQIGLMAQKRVRRKRTANSVHGY